MALPVKVDRRFSGLSRVKGVRLSVIFDEFAKPFFFSSSEWMGSAAAAEERS
jgi:hypothetical protein